MGQPHLGSLLNPHINKVQSRKSDMKVQGEIQELDDGLREVTLIFKA